MIAIDQEEQALKIVDLIREHFPQLRILARATSRQHAYELLRRGVQDVYRETFESAVHLSVDALVALGLPKHRAQRAAQLFREHEDASVREMAQLDTEDMKGYVSLARLHIANLETPWPRIRKYFSVTRTPRATLGQMRVPPDALVTLLFSDR